MSAPSSSRKISINPLRLQVGNRLGNSSSIFTTRKDLTGHLTGHTLVRRDPLTVRMTSHKLKEPTCGSGTTKSACFEHGRAASSGLELNQLWGVSIPRGPSILILSGRYSSPNVRADERGSYCYCGYAICIWTFEKGEGGDGEVKFSLFELTLIRTFGGASLSTYTIYTVIPYTTIERILQCLFMFKTSELSEYKI